MKKAYFLIRGEIKKSDTFYAIRVMMEQLSENLMFKIDRYSIAYLADNGKEIYRSYLYTQNKRIKFDSVPIEAVKIAMFKSCPVQKNVIEAQLFITLSFCKDGDWSLTIVWWTDPSKKLGLEEKIQMVLNVLKDIFSVHYLCADQMEDKKAVEPFVEGILSEERTDLENSVARTIGGLRFTDKRLPFLFPYTFVMEHDGSKIEFSFSRPDLIDEPLESYLRDPEWKACYQSWMERGLIAPLWERGCGGHGDGLRPETKEPSLCPTVPLSTVSP